jgi:hypothetical protein
MILCRNEPSLSANHFLFRNQRTDRNLRARRFAAERKRDENSARKFSADACHRGHRARKHRGIADFLLPESQFAPTWRQVIHIVDGWLNEGLEAQ